MLTNTRMPILEEPARLQRIKKISDTKLAQIVSSCCVSHPTKRPAIRVIIELLKELKKKGAK